MVIILRVLRLEVSVYNVVYNTNQFQTTFPQGGGGGRGENPLVEVTVNSNEKNFLRLLSQLRPRIRSKDRSEDWRESSRRAVLVHKRRHEQRQLPAQRVEMMMKQLINISFPAE